MVRNSYFSIAALLLVNFNSILGTQGGVFNNNPSSDDNMGEIGAILNRLGQLEIKASRIRVDQLENTVQNQQGKMDQLELKVNDQKIEIDQLKKKNIKLESKLESISASATAYPTQLHSLYLDYIILHDTEDKTSVTSCVDPGCYTKQIKYNATLRQMVMLADISASCQQNFRFDSLSVPLEFNSTQYGFWNDRNGAKQIFWSGPTNSKHTCQCGLENPNRCVETQYNCNVDRLAPIELVDEGYITATELLPVTRLSFGRTSLTGVRASYTLGRLQCTGQAPVSSKPENCRTLFQMGHTISGFYLVKSGSTKVATTYCDFSKDSVEAGYETRIGNVDVISSPVQFFVQRNSGWNTTNTPIPFQVERLNVGNAMNTGTGIFKATKAGTYSFAFTTTKTDTTINTFSFLRLNGNNIGINYAGQIGAKLSGSMDATVKLKVGDEITVVLYSGALFDSSNGYHTQFSGILIEEDLAIL